MLRNALLAALFSCWGLAAVSAEDRVLIQQPGGSRIPVAGYIEDYTGREVLLRLKPNEAARRYPRSDVVEVTTEYTPHHERARKLLAIGKIAEANQEFSVALKEEDRPWVRREILAGQVRCALWIGDYHNAILRFVHIVESDPETFQYGLIPLCWSDDPPATDVRFDAREWIGPASKPLFRLIGASWLLTVTDGTSDAEQVLKRLSRESDIRIQRLAQMQLWRVKLNKSELVIPEEIHRWQKSVEELPVELRGGSYFIIGQAWKERQEHDRAARAFLWLPLIYNADRPLCARACFEAGDSLNSLGDLSQALNLYSEVVFRYGDTPWGPKAEAIWNRLRQPNAQTKPRPE